MNPHAFEFKNSYVAYIASELFSNRFFEFVQDENPDESGESLPSVFAEEFRLNHVNVSF